MNMAAGDDDLLQENPPSKLFWVCVYLRSCQTFRICIEMSLTLENHSIFTTALSMTRNRKPKKSKVLIDDSAASLKSVTSGGLIGYKLEKKTTVWILGSCSDISSLR